MGTKHSKKSITKQSDEDLSLAIIEALRNLHARSPSSARKQSEINHRIYYGNSDPKIFFYDTAYWELNDRITMILFDLLDKKQIMLDRARNSWYIVSYMSRGVSSFVLAP